MEGRGGGAHEGRSWTSDSGGFPPGQLIVLLGASLEVSADFTKIQTYQIKAAKTFLRPCFSNPVAFLTVFTVCTVYTRRIYLIQLVECSSRFYDLLLKLENQGYVNITYMVVNNRDERSQRLHHLLKERLMNITLYAQDLSQPDVWQAVNAEKDDILVYDRFGSQHIQFNSPNDHYFTLLIFHQTPFSARCGRLTYHVSLPYTILSHPHVEEAIRHTYCDGICGECSTEVNTAGIR